MILISDLITIASRLTATPASDITGPSRQRHPVVIRAAITRVAREDDPLKHTFTIIGKRLGGRDHSSIVNLWQQQDYYASIWPEYETLVARMKEIAETDGPHIPQEWVPSETMHIHFTKSLSMATSNRARQKRERDRELNAIEIAKRRERREAERLEKKARAAARSEILKLFTSKGIALTDDEVIDAHIGFSDRQHRMRMQRSSRRFLDALLAA